MNLIEWLKKRREPSSDEVSVMPRREVAEIIADLMREHPECKGVIGPDPQIGPLGGESEHLTVVLERDGLRCFVIVNCYNSKGWIDIRDMRERQNEDIRARFDDMRY